MRIAMVFASGSIGGAQCDGLDLVLEFLHRQWHVTAIVGDNGPLCARLAEAGANVHVTHLTWWVLPPKVPFRRDQVWEIIGDANRLIQVLRRSPVDVVYTISSVTPCAAMAAVALGIPHVWHVHEVVENWPDYRFLLPVRTTHDLIESSGASIIVNSKYTAAHFPGPKTVLIPNVMRTLRQTQTSPARASGVFTIGVIGSIWHIKQQDRAVRALAALRARGVDARLVLRGAIDDKEYHRSLLEQCRCSGVSEYVRFDEHRVDPINQEDPFHVVLVTCSVESFSRVALEAFARSVPVVAPRDSGVVEVVQHGDGGLLYDDEAELVHTLQNLAKQPDLLESLGRRGRAWLDRWFAQNKDPGGQIACLLDTTIGSLPRGAGVVSEATTLLAVQAWFRAAWKVCKRWVLR